MMQAERVNEKNLIVTARILECHRIDVNEKCPGLAANGCRPGEAQSVPASSKIADQRRSAYPCLKPQEFLKVNAIKRED
jgi:hypothetical protein